MKKRKATSGRSEPFPGILYSEPGALGLVCNIIAAFIVAVNNIQGDEKGTKLAAIVTGNYYLEVLIDIFFQSKSDRIVHFVTNYSVLVCLSDILNTINICILKLFLFVIHFWKNN